MSGSLLWACGSVNENGDDDDDDSADASATIDAVGGGPDGAGGGPDAAGGSPDAAGEPDAKPPAFCGGFGGIMCTKSEWCDFDKGCGFADGGGFCKPRPFGCPDVKAPVCACNFVTYGNECEANADGWDVLHDGPCEGDPGGGGGGDPGGGGDTPGGS